jgi:hypothetical protein
VTSSVYWYLLFSAGTTTSTVEKCLFFHIAVMMKQVMESLKSQQNKLSLDSEVISFNSKPPRRGAEEELENHGVLKFTRGIPTSKKLVSDGTGGLLKPDTKRPKPGTLSGNELAPRPKLLRVKHSLKARKESL